MSTDTIGLVLSLYYVGMLIGSVLSKNLINRAGHIRMFAGCISLASVSILVCSLYTDPLLWGGMRIVIGFCNACAFTAMESWLNGASTKDTRGKILAFYNAVVLAAMFVGQFMINLSSPVESFLFILSGIILCLAIIPMVWSKHKGPEAADIVPMSIYSLFQRSPLGVVACFTSGLIYSSVFSLLPLFAAGYGIEGLMLSLYMGAAILGAFILQFPVGYLSDRFDRRLVLLFALVISTFVGLFIEWFASNNLFIAMSICTAVSAGIIACTYPLSISETFDKLKQNEMVTAMGSLILAFSIGGALGPYLASIAMSVFGNSTLFYLVGGVQACLAVFVICRMSIRTALPVDEQESFVMQSGLVPSAAELDPRTEYIEVALPLSSSVRTAVEIAETDPATAVRMARSMVLAKPEQAAEIAAAVACVEGIDPLRLYQVMLEAVPFQIFEVTSAMVRTSPDLGYELVQKLAETQPEQVVDIAAEIGRELPELRLAMAKVALEHAPEAAIEVAQYYAQVMGEEFDAVRPADKEDDTSEQDAVALVSQFSEIVPEHQMAVAVHFVEAVPDSAVPMATEMANTLSEQYEEAIDEHGEGAGENSCADTQESGELNTSENEDSVIESAVETEFNSEQEVAEEELIQDAADLVSCLSDIAPEHAIDIGVAVVEAIPESASQVMDTLVESDQVDEADLVSSLEDKPVED